MSDNHLSKINTTSLGRIAILIVLIAISVINARFLIDNILHSEEIDEKIVSEANPRLDRQAINQAISILDSFKDKELTSIFTSDTLDTETLETETEQEITIEIQNASGIAGAAADISEKLTQKGYQINSISTAPTKQKVTRIFYKTGKAEEAKAIEALLNSQNWPVQGVQEITEEIQSDIRIILGK